MKIVISERGVINGRGTAPWKWVSGLSPDERAHVRNGTAWVFIRDFQAHHYLQSGWKVVVYVGRKYSHREPSAEMLRALQRYWNRRPESLGGTSESTTVQTLILDKGRFASVSDAKDWAFSQGFKYGKVDDTGNALRLRQRDPDDFDKSTFRTISITDGVRAVIGKLKV